MRDVFLGGGDKLLPSEKSPGLQLTRGVSLWPFLIYIRLLMAVSYTAHTPKKKAHHHHFVYSLLFVFIL